MINNNRLLNIFEEVQDYFYFNPENKSQKSKHWERYNSKKYNIENLINFRRNGVLSDEMEDQNDKFYFQVFAEAVNQISEEYIYKNLPKKNVGNSNSLIPYKDVYFDYNKLFHIYWFWIVENNVPLNSQILNICEIGGGFGSFAELFIKNYNSKILLIDLPEANLISTYYLKETFPEKRFYLFDDYKRNQFLSLSEFENNDIMILPPNINIDKNIKIDFFINTRSMMEMNLSVVNSYFDFIHAYSKNDSYFLNINRYEKTSVGHPIRIADYPYDDKWKVIISEPSFKQDWIHFLLTKRTFNLEEYEIKNELKVIKNLGKKYYGMYIDKNPTDYFLKNIFKKLLKTFIGVRLVKSFGNKFYNLAIRLKNFE